MTSDRAGQSDQRTNQGTKTPTTSLHGSTNSEDRVQDELIPLNEY
ncbi:MAG: hypothetical protein ACYDA4_16455 [Ignavibacteriaceae bacterium]